jgi:protein-tyrosine phosphatase
VIDLHCHVLPGIDDGPATIGESVVLARVAAAQGTRTIVATPHVNHRFPNRAAEIAERVHELNERLGAAEIELEVKPGAEIAMTSLDELDAAELRALALGGGRWLLLECPFTLAIEGFAAAARQLQADGHRVVLAHPERCQGFHRRRELLESLVAEGCLVSITAGSLVGSFGGVNQKMAMDLVRDGLVHNVSSDAHDPHHRTPEIAEPLKRAGLGAEAEWFADRVPAAILAGTELPPRPAAPPAERELRPRRWWQLGRRR